MSHLGLVSAILPDYSFENVIDFVARENFKCVELMCWPKGKAERRYAGITHIDVDTLDPERCFSIGRYLQEKKIYISALGYYPNLLEPDLARSSFYIAHLKKVIDAASQLNVPVVNTFAGRDRTKGIGANLELFKNQWPPIVEYAQSRNVKVAIENCPMLFTEDEWPGGNNLATSPAIWEKMFEIIPSKSFGLNFDPSHFIWQRMDYIQPIYDFKDRIFHIHLKDSKLYQEKLDRVGILAAPLDYHSPKIPGLGDVDWKRFFRALEEIEYRGALCIEMEDKAFEGSEEEKLQGILQSRNFVAQFLRS